MEKTLLFCAFLITSPLPNSKNANNGLRSGYKNKPKKYPRLLDQFTRRVYQSGDELIVGKRKYKITITTEDRKTHTGTLENGLIHLKLSQFDKGEHLQKNIRHLISRLVAKDFHPSINFRVNELNKKYFNKNIKGVKLKYNHSNWGSCSTNGYINLSTRLLFAPDAVIDYVIIHELAHLIEFNHSKKFWSIIEKIMPEYRDMEKWLKEEGGKCHY